MAVMFTGVKDEGLLRFMAKKTVELAATDPAAKIETLAAKYRAIDDMRRIATAREVCGRQAIVQYFGEVPSAAKRSWAVRIVDWLFSRPITIRRTPLCCDRCDQVDVDNVIEWAARVLGQGR
jgi:hypothetical protein